MSLGYAQKLSYKEDVGDVGMSEIFDPPHLLQQKIEELAAIIKESRHLVAFTGAGISTSCGIPDFRGPKGIWTLQHEGKALPEASLPFDRAMPSSTHMALVELEKIGILKFVISQNVDSLHLRSGIPREKLAELHGNSFREICPVCQAEYIRDFEVETIGMKETPRRCSKMTCGAKLRDTVLDWEDELPPKEMKAAAKHCRMADVVLCLGTSLQITPACNLPLKCLRGGGRIAIVNLQPTPKDKKACLVIHGLVDKVVAGVMHILSLCIPPFVRIDFFQVIFDRLNCMQEGGNSKWSIRVASVHGEEAPLPFIKSVEMSFPERPELELTTLHMQPFSLKRAMLQTGPRKVSLKINFSEGCRCQFASIDLPVNFQESTDSVGQAKDIILQKLKDLAVLSDSCGQFSVIEKKVTSYKKQEISTYAIATNIVRYNGLASTVKLATVDSDDNEGVKANLKSNSFCVTSCQGEENLKKSRVR